MDEHLSTSRHTSKLSRSKERNILFNDALNSFFYGVGHWIKDYSDSERGTCCRHYMDYSFRLAARYLLSAPSHRQDNTYHGFCYTGRGPLAGTRTSPMRPPRSIDPNTYATMRGRSTTELHLTHKLSRVKVNPGYMFQGCKGGGVYNVSGASSLWGGVGVLLGYL